MRTLSATLTAAQKKADRLPYVEAKVYDYQQGIKRLSWTRIYTGSEPDNHHGIAFDGQGSMHRIRAAASNKLYWQKVTSPGPGSDYASWTEIASDCAGPCSIAAYGAKVYIFYRTTGNAIRRICSHDYGQTWLILFDDFAGAVLDAVKWDTYIAPNASVSQNDELQLNNQTGAGHSGAKAFSQADFTKAGVIRLLCQWKPHKDHYASAWCPTIKFCRPDAARDTTYYGDRNEQFVCLALGHISDTTDRTRLQVSDAGTAAADYLGTLRGESVINIDETIWHDIEINIDSDTRQCKIYLDGEEKISCTLDETNWASIGPTFKLELGASDYDKNNTERFRSLSLWGASGSEESLDIAYTDVLSMAACWWGTGNIVVCFALKASEINGIVLDSSDQSTTQHTWSDATHSVSTTFGIGATYNAFWPGCEIVFAARELDTPYNHYNLFRTLFSDTYHFTALESFLMSPEGEDITYEYPDCHLPASPQSYETTRITAVEKFAGITPYQLPITSHVVKGTYFSDTTFTEPRPFLDVSSSFGLRLQSTADYWWMERPDGIWRPTRPAGDALDLTNDIVAITQRTAPGGGGSASLLLTLDNSTGKYASPGTGDLASLRFRSEIVLKLGYLTPSGDEYSEAGTYWIDGWEYFSGPNQSLFTIHCLDAWGLARNWTARYQMRWNKDAVGPKNVWNIIYLVLARFGIRLWNNGAVTRSSPLLNLYPDFTIDPGTSGDTAIRRLLSLVPDGLIVTGQEAFAKDLKDDEASSYAYGTAPGDHRILSGQYSAQLPASRARAIGRTAGGVRVLQEAFDWDLLAEAIDVLHQDYDPNLDDATRTQERADAILRKHALEAQGGRITVPANCGQELYDVVTLTDVRVGISAEKYRVAAIQTDYNRPKSIYNQRLSFCAP